MAKFPIAIKASGLVTGVGLDRASTCAAVRAAIDNFQETGFYDAGGEWIMACQVPLEQPWQGTRKLAKMLAAALTECGQEGQVDLSAVPLVLCLPEKERPGRADNLANRIFFEVQEELKHSLHPEFQVVEHGRAGFWVGLKKARTLLYEAGHRAVIVAGVDSLISGTALSQYESEYRLLTSQNSNGFIPGEAASAVLIGLPEYDHSEQLCCMGLGFGLEPATIYSDQPLRVEGLSKALNGAFEEAGSSMDQMDFRIVDVTGEQYWFKEAALILTRLLRTRKETFPMWNLTDCVGEVGAAAGGLMTSYLKTAFEKGFAAGHHLVAHSSNDDGRRAAAVFQYVSK